MLLEYLGPVVDGCRAALNVSVEKARSLHEMSEDEFESYMTAMTDAFQSLSICFKLDDAEEVYSFVFDDGKAKVFDECLEPDVVISSDENTLQSILDSDPTLSIPDLIGNRVQVEGLDSMDVVEALGLLCYPSLLRIARSGVDPSSILSEDADSIVMAAATDLVTKITRKWIDTRLASDDDDF
jgi:hypothetical protein